MDIERQATNGADGPSRVEAATGGVERPRAASIERVWSPVVVVRPRDDRTGAAVDVPYGR